MTVAARILRLWAFARRWTRQRAPRAAIRIKTNEHEWRLT